MIEFVSHIILTPKMQKVVERTVPAYKDKKIE